jgi:invasion protein IalB
LTATRRILPILTAVLTLGLVAPALAQAEGAAPAAPAEQPEPQPWGARCAGQDRTQTLECIIEQRVVLSNTGQLLTAVTVRLPPDTGAPVMMVHTPLGLFLPAGVRIAIDGAELATMVIQTCDAQGCYAGDPVTPELLGALQRGGTMTVTFQNLEKQDIAVPVSLLGFTDAYARIK